MASNYEKMAAFSRELFLRHDQEAMIRLWDLEHDADGLYLPYFNERLRLDRHTATLSRAEDGDWPPTDFVHETMVLFDLLTYPAERPRASGRWASISMLGGIIGAGHDRNLNHEDVAAQFAGNAGGLRAACERMGGLPLGRADVGYAMPLFHDFAIWFQFWDGDDEFPASIKYLFDERALRYMHYETLWYAMHSLTDRLAYYA